MSSGLSHELFVHAKKQVIACEAIVDQCRFRRHHSWVGVLHQHRRDRRTVAEIFLVAGEHRADARHIQDAHTLITGIQALDQRLVPVIDIAVVVEGAAAFVPPRAGNSSQRHRRMHIGSAVARACEAVAEANITALRTAVEAGKFLDCVFVQTGDLRRPDGVSRAQVLMQALRTIGIASHVVMIGVTVAEQHMHDRTGQRAVRARAQRQMRVGNGSCPRAVGIDHYKLSTARLARPLDMGHGVDLG